MSQFAEIAFVDAAVPNLPYLSGSMRPYVRIVLLTAGSPAPVQNDSDSGVLTLADEAESRVTASSACSGV